MPTVVFSNHLGWPEFKGRALDLDWIRDLVDGVAFRGLERCRCLLTGFMGGPELGEVVLHALDAVRRANPEGDLCLRSGDGQRGRLFRQAGRAGIPEGPHRAASPTSCFPTTWSWSSWSGAGSRPWPRRWSPPMRSAPWAPAPWSSPRWRRATTSPTPSRSSRSTAAAPGRPGSTRLDVPVDGAGDLFAAIFTASTLNGEATPAALAHALAATHGVLRTTAELGVAEMALVAAREEIARPSRAVPVTTLA